MRWKSSIYISGGSARGAPRLKQSGGGLCQHRVDVLVAFVGAEVLGELNRLVQHHAVGHIYAGLELVGADEQDATLDGIELLRRPVEMGLEQGLQPGGVGDDALH